MVAVYRCAYAVLAIGSILATNTKALDYYIPYAFNFPIGAAPGQRWHFGDSVTYRADTGEVTYHVDVDTVGTARASWWPPDFASRSGVLLEVPYNEDLATAESRWGELSIQSNVEIEGTVVPGSNSNGFRYDPNAHWPFTIADPHVLAIWGPLGMPYSFHYGKILPAGLSEEFLRSDIYSFPLVNLVYVVPEPTSCLLMLLGLACPLVIHRRRVAVATS